MRLVSTTLAGLIIAASVSAAGAAQRATPPQRHGMTRGEAFNWCRDQHYNRIIQMRQCVIAKMRGE